MNPAVTGTFAHADPNAAPLTLNEMIDILNPLLSIVIQGSYLPYIIQASTPGMEDTDKAWIELDSIGRPLATKIYYNGNWRRIYNGMIGEVRMYAGNPGDSTIWTQPWDKNNGGKGVVGGLFDGWQICNGQNGSPDLSDHFICTAHMNGAQGQTGYSTDWQSFVDTKTCTDHGGATNHMIVPSDLPPIGPNGTSALTLTGFAYKSGASHTPPVVIIDNAYDLTLQNTATTGVNYGANPGGIPLVAQTPVPTLPPWIALGFIIFQGY